MSLPSALLPSALPPSALPPSGSRFVALCEDFIGRTFLGVLR